MEELRFHGFIALACNPHKNGLIGLIEKHGRRSLTLQHLLLLLATAIAAS
jgi:hypothetical protein